MSQIKDSESKFSENPEKRYLEPELLHKDATMDEVFDRMSIFYVYLSSKNVLLL